MTTATVNSWSTKHCQNNKSDIIEEPRDECVLDVDKENFIIWLLAEQCRLCECHVTPRICHNFSDLKCVKDYQPGNFELDSFLTIISNISGIVATLILSAHAGQVKVTLKAGLGYPQQPPSNRPQHRRDGPARQRRRLRRAAAWQAAEEQKPAEEVANKIDLEENDVTKVANTAFENYDQQVVGNVPVKH